MTKTFGDLGFSTLKNKQKTKASGWRKKRQNKAKERANTVKIRVGKFVWQDNSMELSRLFISFKCAHICAIQFATEMIAEQQQQREKKPQYRQWPKQQFNKRRGCEFTWTPKWYNGQWYIANGIATPTNTFYTNHIANGNLVNYFIFALWVWVECQMSRRILLGKEREEKYLSFRLSKIISIN